MSNNDWEERFALDEGIIEKIDFGWLEAFIVEERKILAEGILLGIENIYGELGTVSEGILKERIAQIRQAHGLDQVRGEIK